MEGNKDKGGGEGRKAKKAPHASHRHKKDNGKASDGNDGDRGDEAKIAHKLEWPKEKRLPVTILSGFLGAGKTTLLRYALQNTEGKKIALIVNDLAAVNVDAALVSKSKKTKKGGEMVELSNGCMCCSLKDDLLDEMKKIARKGSYDYLIVEGSGVAEPMPVAEGIANFDIGRGKTLPDLVRVDAMVTVVDCKHFLKDFRSVDGILDREELVREMGLAPPEPTEVDNIKKKKKESKREMRQAEEREAALERATNHPVSALLTEQVEFADIVILNKMDLVTDEEARKLEEIISNLNPHARILKSRFGQVCLDDLLNVNLFDFEKASMAAGWLKIMRGEFVTKAKEIGISNFVYQRRRPFHPKRLWDLVESDKLDAVLRSKGFFWLATWNDSIGDWSHAGQIFNFSSEGSWFAATPESEWPEDEKAKEQIRKDFQGDNGDRRQEIVFIGDASMDHKTVTSLLDACLLTDEELALGPRKWKEFEDPFAACMAPPDEDDDDADEQAEEEGTKKKDKRKGKDH